MNQQHKFSDLDIKNISVYEIGFGEIGLIIYKKEGTYILLSIPQSWLKNKEC